MAAPVIDVVTPLGVRVLCDRVRWELVSELKHPVMAGKEQEVLNTLSSPEQVRQSRRDDRVHLYYRRLRDLWCCCVVRHGTPVAVLVTAYLTDRIREGDPVWSR